MRRVCLNFHGIGSPARTLEPGEAGYWISAEAYDEILSVAQSFGDRVAVNYTFDDGNASDLLIGAEGLARYGARATFFVLADRLDTPGSLSRGDLIHLQEAGHTIGLHGAAHVDWRGLDAAGEAREYDAARTTIAEACGSKVTEAAIPFGGYNARVLRALKARGFAAIWSSDRGDWTSGNWPRPRISVTQDTTAADVTRWLSAPAPLAQRLRRKAGQLKKRMF